MFVSKKSLSCSTKVQYFFSRNRYEFNGLCANRYLGIVRQSVSVYTDACFAGFDAIYGEMWLAGAFEDRRLTDQKFALRMLPSIVIDEQFNIYIKFLELIAAFIPLLLRPFLFGDKM